MKKISLFLLLIVFSLPLLAQVHNVKNNYSAPYFQANTRTKDTSEVGRLMIDSIGNVTNADSVMILGRNGVVGYISKSAIAPLISGILNGQMLWWDSLNSKWTYATGIIWDNTGTNLKMGVLTLSKTTGFYNFNFGSNIQLIGNNNFGTGDGHKITGSYNGIIGELDTIIGNDNFVSGNRNYLNGSGGSILGTYNYINGTNVHILGNYDTLNCNNCIALGFNLDGSVDNTVYVPNFDVHDSLICDSGMRVKKDAQIDGDLYTYGVNGIYSYGAGSSIQSAGDVSAPTGGFNVIGGYTDDTTEMNASTCVYITKKLLIGDSCRTPKLQVGSTTISGATITNSTGAISFDNENITTTGIGTITTINSPSLTVSKPVATDGSKNLISATTVTLESALPSLTTGTNIGGTSNLIEVFTDTIYWNGSLKEVGYTGTLADETSILVATGTAGWGRLMAGDGVWVCNFHWIANGTVTIDDNYGTSSVLNTDTDTNFVIIDAGSGIAIKNRTTAAITTSFKIYYR